MEYAENKMMGAVDDIIKKCQYFTGDGQAAAGKKFVGLNNLRFSTKDPSAHYKYQANADCVYADQELVAQ